MNCAASVPCVTPPWPLSAKAGFARADAIAEDGRYAVCFASYQVATIDLTKPKRVSHVSEQASAMSPG